MATPSKPIIALYVFDTMADWEYGHLLGAITQVKAAGVPAILRIMAESPAEIRTLGRLPVRPVRVLPGLGKAAESMDTLILVGGTTWDTGHEDILAIAGPSWRRARPWARSAARRWGSRGRGCSTAGRTRATDQSYCR